MEEGTDRWKGEDFALWSCDKANSLPAMWANLSVPADATGALGALCARGECQREADGTEQDSKSEPQTAVCTSVACNDGGADAEQDPNYEEFHNVGSTTPCGPMVEAQEADRGWRRLLGLDIACRAAQS